MKASPSPDRDPPPPGAPRPVRLALLAGAGVLAGLILAPVLRSLGCGAPPSAGRVRTAPPAPPPPEAAPAAPASPPATGPLEHLELRSVRSRHRLGQPGDPILVGELPRPELVTIRLLDPETGARTVLFSAAVAARSFQLPVGLQPVGSHRILELSTRPDGAAERSFEVRGRPLVSRPLAPYSPDLRALRSQPDGLVLRQGAGTLRWLPARGPEVDLDTRLELAGRPLHRRDHLIVRTTTGTLAGFSLERRARAWTYHGAGPVPVDPVPVPPHGLLAVMPRCRTGGAALEHLEASTGVPLWPHPRQLPAPLPPDPLVAGRAMEALVVTGSGTLLHLELLDGQTLAQVADGSLGPVSAPPAFSPSTRHAALGSASGQVRTLDFGLRRGRAGEGARPSPELLAGELRVGLSATPIERLLYLAEEQLLVASRHELVLLTRSGGVLWRRGLAAPRAAGPARVGMRLLVALEDGTLLVLRRVDGVELETLRTGPLVAGSLEPEPGAPVVVAGPEIGVRAFEDEGAPAIEGVRSGPLAPDPAPPQALPQP